MIKTPVLKDDLCPVCFNERGGFSYRKTEGICEACVLRMMYAFDTTVKGGGIIRQDKRCFCCHRQVDADNLHGGACLFCRGAGLVFLGARMKNEKINKRHIPKYPPAFIRKDLMDFIGKDSMEKYMSDPLEYLDMFWDVPAGTEWEEEGADAR